jgi:hypothetical protein
MSDFDVEDIVIEDATKDLTAPRTAEGPHTVDWWERQLSLRNGSNRGMAEFVVATIEAEAAAPLKSALRALVKAWDRLANADDGAEPDPDDAFQDALAAARAALKAVGE